GALLIATTSGVRRLVGGKAQVAYPFPFATQGFFARRMLRDRDGGLWVGTWGRGIVHFHRGRTDVFSQSDGLTADNVDDFFEDREGNIWAATVNGLDRFRELPVVTYSANQGLSNAPTGAVLGQRDGTIWFGASDGLFRLKNTQNTIYKHRIGRARAGVREIAVRGLPDHGFESLFEDSRGRIWVFTQTGIGYLENERFLSTSVPSGQVYAVAEDSTGNKWIAAQDHGLFKLSPSGEVQQIPWASLSRKDFALALAADPLRGGLWLGFSRGGIALFRDGQIGASYSAADGLGKGIVWGLRLDPDGALWAATDGGLSRLQDGRIATLTSKNGLPCDAVRWMVEDDAQSVWLNMLCGLVRVPRSDLDAW